MSNDKTKDLEEELLCSADRERLSSRPESDQRIYPGADAEFIAEQALGILIHFGIYREDLVQEATARGNVYERLEQEPTFPLHQRLQLIMGLESMRQAALKDPERWLDRFNEYRQKYAQELGLKDPSFFSGEKKMDYSS